MSHPKLVLEHLSKGVPLTQRQAIDSFNCFRLASVIERLRKAGHSINTHMIKGESGAPYASYRMAIRP